MKQLSILVACMLAYFASCAQAQSFGYKDYSFANQVNVGKGNGSTTNPAAWLEIGPASGTKGVIMPRGDRTLVQNPVTGLTLFDVNDKKFYVFDGASWQQVGATITAGQFIQNNPLTGTPQTANINIDGSAQITGLLNFGTTGTNNFTNANAFVSGYGGSMYIAQNLYYSAAQGWVSPSPGSPSAMHLIQGGYHSFYSSTNGGIGIEQMRVEPDGRVVIGSWAPSAGEALYVGGVRFMKPGQMQLTSLVSDPVGAAGQVYFNSTTNTIRAFTNGIWQDVTASNGTGYIQSLNHAATPQTASINIEGTLDVANNSYFQQQAIFFGGVWAWGTSLFQGNVQMNTAAGSYQFTNTYDGYITHTVAGKSIWMTTNGGQINFANNSTAFAFIGQTGIMVPMQTSDPSSPVQGQVYFNSTGQSLKLYNGSIWQTVSVAGSSSTDAEAAQIVTGDYTVAAGDVNLVADHASTVTWTLPDPATNQNRALYISNQNPSAIQVSRQVYFNSSTYTTSIPGASSYKLVSDGSKWLAIPLQ